MALDCLLSQRSTCGVTEDTRLTNLDDLVLDSRCLCNYLCNIAMDISPSLMGNSTINGKFQWQVAFF